MSAEASHFLRLPKKHTLTADQIADIYLAGVTDKDALAWNAALSKWTNREVKYLLQEFLTASLLVKEVLPSYLGIRNAGDTDYRDLRIRYLGVGCAPDSGFPLKVEQDTDFVFGVRRTSEVTGKTCGFMLDNLAPYATTNDVSFVMRLYTSTATLRYCGQFRAKWDVATDATRTSDLEIFGAKAGSGGVTFLRLLGGRPIFPNPTVPATAGSAGVAGEIAWDANYFYVCVATNTWKRAALSTW